MEDFFTRAYEHMIARVSGPMHFRVILQPVMALIFAILGGIKDAKAGKRYFFFGVLTNPDLRAEGLKDGWKGVGKVFIVAMVLDAVYQLKVLHWVYPGEMILTAILLAIVPYLALRGLTNRIVSFVKKRRE
jgi:hypothetical protein